MVREWILAAAALTSISVAQAAEFDGVAMPDVRMTDGRTMQLNGIGLRTYSLLGIPIYVAGLYLERRSDDSNAILYSPETKVLQVRFLRDVDAADAREAWRDGLEQNCKSPCSLDPAGVEKFLAAVPSVRDGDESTLVFTAKGVRVTLNGRLIGNIADPQFARVMLAPFIGAEPPTPQLKRELLGGMP
jgi:long-chain acyl-CoA synthetase